MYNPTILISENKKTECSINFPIKNHCRPTKLCEKLCYAKTGSIASSNTIKKQEYVSNYFSNNNRDLLRAIWECRHFQYIKLNGCGDLLPTHLINILNLAMQCPDTKFYGMTRKPEIATALNNQFPNLNLLLSIDIETPKKVWEDYNGKITFGPRRATDKVPDDKRIIIVFPYHSHGTIVKGIPSHKKDCLATWKKISGCMECKRCWNW